MAYAVARCMTPAVDRVVAANDDGSDANPQEKGRTMTAFSRLAIAALLASASPHAFAENLLWQGSWTNQSDKAVLLKTNASQCFDPGQFSNKNELSPGENVVLRATATTDWPICTGGDYWIVINVVEADSPNTIRGQVTLKFLNSASECYLTSDRAGVTVPSIPCPPQGNTASYSVEIKKTDKYDLFWGLRFPSAEARSSD